MARQVIPIISPKGPYPGVVSAGNLHFVLTACDIANFDEFPLTGRELLVIQNTGASGYTFTLESQTDPQGRLGDITTYALAAGELASFWLGQKPGWESSTGRMQLRATNAAVKYAVFKIPG